MFRKMENEHTKRLKTLIEALTHSGSNALDEDIFKQIKKICKSSEDTIPVGYSLVLTQLKKNNSQIRLLAFKICVELFKRSALFREHVLKDLHVIFELTAEINTSNKLPPPKRSAECLKPLAISTLKEWVKEFGETHKKLKIAYNYFEKCKQVDFSTLQIGDSAEQIVENEQQRQLRTVNEEKMRKIVEEFNSNESEIEMTVTSLSNCLSLLLPPAEEFFIPEHNLLENKTQSNIVNTYNTNSDEPCSNIKDNNSYDGEDSDDNDIFLANRSELREFGIPSDYSLSLNVEDKFKVLKTEENSSVIENAKDCVRLICNRFLPMVKRWIKIYSKCSNGSNNGIKKIIDLKEKLENVLKKHDSIIIDVSSNIPNDESSSDDEFEEVKKEGYEECVDFSENLLLECLKKNSEAGNSIIVSQNSSNVPSINMSQDRSNGESSSTSQDMDRKRKLLSIAPKLPYDIDLYHWEDEHLSTPTLISSKIDVDKFWACAGSDDIHEIPNPDGIAALRTRVIEYSGTFEPVKWSCRAPLPNGKLCPRKDRFKCPFHGKIVPRNELGYVQSNGEPMVNQAMVALNLPVQKDVASVSIFQDPEFLNDIQAATGIDLKVPEKRSKKRKSEKLNLTHKKMKTSAAALKLVKTKKLPGLIDVVRRQNNAYYRLSKKIFNRSSLRRVSSVLDKLDRKKFKDKYGDQFNYV